MMITNEGHTATVTARDGHMFSGNIIGESDSVIWLEDIKDETGRYIMPCLMKDKITGQIWIFADMRDTSVINASMKKQSSH